jgi:hypothetical protein
MVQMCSETVTINSLRAVREGDFLQGSGPPNRIMIGSSNVVIGTPAIGTADPAGVAEFCRLYCALVHDWPTLTPAQRKARYQALLATMFARFGAPPPTTSPTAPAGADAAFDQIHWQVLVLPDAWTNTAGPPAGGSTFHEIRHGEQSFMGARQRGGVGLGDRQPPASVAASAARQPIAPNTPEARYGALMADEYFTPAGSAEQNRVTTGVTTAAVQARTDLARYDADAPGSPSQAADYATAKASHHASVAANLAYYQRPTGQDSQTVEGPGECDDCP